jgi:hypothetical protein
MIGDTKSNSSTKPPSVVVPDFGYMGTSKHVRVLWKLSFAFAAIVVTFYAWQCGSALDQGQKMADVAARHFHQELNGGQYEQISQEADDGFAEEKKHEELVQFLEKVHANLGDANSEKFINMVVNAGTDGTFLRTEYHTTFVRGSAVETFTWTKKSGALKLYAYNIRSNAFLSQ